MKLEAAEKDAKVQRLQDEVECAPPSHLSFPAAADARRSLVIDQVFDSDYRHLKPAKEELFSDSEEAGNARQEEEDDDGSDSSSEDDEEEGDEEDDSPWGRGQGDNGNERVRKVSRRLEEGGTRELMWWHAGARRGCGRGEECQAGQDGGWSAYERGYALSIVVGEVGCTTL